VIRLNVVRLGEEEERLALEVIRSGRLAQGPMVERLELAMCRLVGTSHAVAVSSGTTALVAALQALGVEPGSEVVTTPFTFVATLNAILQVGATARFADVLEDFTVDPEALEAAMTPRTSAVMPVHLYGYPADMTRVTAVANRHGVALIEDAAQAHGASVDGRNVGGFGVGCFSFYATKNVSAGEGGAVTTNDTALADRIRLLRNHGMRRRYEYELSGHNYRMPELCAAITLPQLQRLEERNVRRRRNAARLAEGLVGLRGIQVPRAVSGRRHVFHHYTIRVSEEARLDRDALASALAERQVETGVYYPRVVFAHDCYRNHPNVRWEPMPRAERLAREVLSLPVHPWLSDQDVDLVIDAVRSLLSVA
jgi:perosamine synthetase